MKLLICAATAALVCAPAWAQTAAPIVAHLAPQAAPGAVLATNTEVLLRLNDQISSKSMKKVGTPFNLTVANDVMLGNYVVIPRGSPAKGVLSYRTGKGAFGKSAKIEIDMVSLEANGRTIPISGHYRQEGGGNTGATVGAVVAVGVFGGFVTGRSATWAQGSEFKAFTKETIPVNFETASAPSPAPAAAQTEAAPSALSTPPLSGGVKCVTCSK